MIIFDLRCDRGHQFEGWFKDHGAFEDQRSGRLIRCPVCGSAETDKRPSAISTLSSREGQSSEKKGDVAPSSLKYLGMVHQWIEKHFDDVGDRFAEVALKIHHGEEEQRNIRGTTTRSEEQTLREEGVPFLKIPEPKLDS